jgi:gliding motility-associated-like protein
MEMTVTPMPALSIQPSSTSGCEPITVFFLNTSTFANTYLWTFGDGDSSTAVSPTHTYNGAGQYTVNVYAGSIAGCTASESIDIIVYPLPTADAGLDSIDGCVPFTFTLPNVSILGSTFQWDFGDGDTSMQAMPTHTWQSSGTYDVSLTAISAQGCVNVEDPAITVIVHPQPEAGFFPDPYVTLITEPIIRFWDQSIDATAWNWYFGDGSTSLDQFPIHTYQDTGVFFVEQYVSNEWGCYDSASAYVIINDDFTFFAPNAFTPNEDLINDVFYVKGTGINNDYFTMYIYDRWGKLLFTSNDIFEGWDGTTDNDDQIQPEGVYTFLVILADNNNVWHKFTGSVTLIH